MWSHTRFYLIHSCPASFSQKAKNHISAQLLQWHFSIHRIFFPTPTKVYCILASIGQLCSITQLGQTAQQQHILPVVLTLPHARLRPKSNTCCMSSPLFRPCGLDSSIWTLRRKAPSDFDLHRRIANQPTCSQTVTLWLIRKRDHRQTPHRYSTKRLLKTTHSAVLCPGLLYRGSYTLRNVANGEGCVWLFIYRL